MYAEENRREEVIGQLKDLMTGELKTMNYSSERLFENSCKWKGSFALTNYVIYKARLKNYHLKFPFLEKALNKKETSGRRIPSK